MIKVKHPLPECNRTQEQTLAGLPEEGRRFNELLYSYGNACYRYHQEAIEHEPTPEDFEEWLEGLPSNVARNMRAKGFDSCRTVLSFTRYVNEKRDIGMDEYVRNLMGEEDYLEYRALIPSH